MVRSFPTGLTTMRNQFKIAGNVEKSQGLSVERRIKAVCWWCYMHSPEPLHLSEIIKLMPTDQAIAAK